MIALDLFSGARGWGVGGRELGIVEHGVENMPEANATASAAGFLTLHDDVWTLDPNALIHYDGLIASPPCQTFSKAGKGAGRKALDDVLGAIKGRRFVNLGDLRNLGDEVGDERTALVLTPLHFAFWGVPDWIAWEQVPSVLPVWEACAEELRAMGYAVWTGLLHAEQYGVPQTRKRAVLIARRIRGRFDLQVWSPVPTHSQYHSHDSGKLDAGVPKWKTLAEALPWVGPLGFQERLIGSGMQERYGKAIDRDIHAPSYTIRGSASMAAPGGGYVINELGHRSRLTVSSAGVLQSFPADYPWQGSKRAQWLQVGNAIPPLLAQHVLSAASGVQMRQEREELAA